MRRIQTFRQSNMVKSQNQWWRKVMNQFVFKKLAIAPLQEKAQPLIYIFEPPCYWISMPAWYKREDLCLTYNYHGIEWTSGNIPYEEVRPILQDELLDACAIYIKGFERKICFDEFWLYIRADLGCSSLKKLHNASSSTCNHHTQFWSHNCTVRNALTL